MTKSKGRIRDKVKRVLLIEGTPSVLYYKKERTFTELEINGKTFRLGVISNDLVEELKKIPSFKITTNKSERHYPAPIKIEGIGHRTTIRNVNGNTHIQVGAEDESQLEERVNKIKEYLLKNGVNVTERCGWICVIDKSKVRDLSYDRAKEEIMYYLKNHPEYSISNISSYLMIDYKLTEKILIDLGYKLKNIPTPKKEKTKELREMVIKMGLAPQYE